MSLALSRRASAVRPQTTSRRPVVRVSAWAGENNGNPFTGLLRMFMPHSLISVKEDWSGSGSAWKGKVDRKRRPFKDGFASPVADQALKQESTANSEDAGVVGYLNDAVENVVGHNFKGDSTEPDWKSTGGNSYKGDVRRKHNDRDERGFHSIKM